MTNTLIKASLIFTVLMASMMVFATPAHADGQATSSAEVVTTRRIVCDTGSYGQQTSCREVVTTVPVHQPVNAGLPYANLMAAGFIGIMALSAYTLKK